MLYEITSLEDVQAFIEQVAGEINNFHPLTDFTDYVYPDSYTRRYSDEEAAIRNTRLDKCFDVCASVTPDFFSYLLDMFNDVSAGIHHEKKRTLIHAGANRSYSNPTQLSLLLPHPNR